ncbi:hypothetical protein ACOMHN_059731 [Nucella lapillus]
MHYSSTAQSTTLQPSIFRYCLRVPKTTTYVPTHGTPLYQSSHTEKTTCTYTNLSLRRENMSAKNAAAKLPPPEDW